LINEDWEIEVGFRNMPVYRIPWQSFSTTSKASNPGVFDAVIPLNTETMDLLRGSDISFLYKGDRRWSGKILDKTPDFERGVIKLQGTDWNGLIFDRQIAFQAYDTSVYSLDGTDEWDWDKTLPPGQNIDIEGSALIKMILQHYMGKGVNPTIHTTDEDLYGFDVSLMQGSVNKDRWRFDGEQMGNAFSKIASIMQSSTSRFGYNWWIDAYKRFNLFPYGDTIYSKPINAKWSASKESTSDVVNHLHLIGGIATPFPDDRSGITNIGTFSLTATNNGTNNLKVPTTASKGWGCWISPEVNISGGAEANGTSTIELESTSEYGHVSGHEETSIVITVDDNSTTYSHFSAGIYYQMQNAFGDFNYTDYDWSDRNENPDRISHQIRTVTMYLRMASDSDYAWKNFGSMKLKIYTKEPSFVSNKYPDTQNSEFFREEVDDVYDLDISKIFNNYLLENVNPDDSGDRAPWLRVLIVFDKAVSVAVDAGWGSVAVGGGSGLGDTAGDYSSVISAEASWDIFDGETPDPENIWGFGLEGHFVPVDTSHPGWLAIDHLFFGFGEIEVERRDALSIGIMDREIQKWIQDRHCHSWGRAEHLADILLDSMKYAQKSRSGVSKYYNPELRVNQLLPLNEYGVEWMYVVNRITTSVSSTGVQQTIELGTPRPDPDDLMNFYGLESRSMQSGGAGKTVHDWVANSKCWTRCEMFCEFSCLSDYSSDYRKGGNVCQTSRELSCVSCESVAELNPCSVACLTYSQIASVSSKPPTERSAVETTLLTMGDGVTASVPVKKEAVPLPMSDDEVACKRIASTSGMMIT